MRTLIVEPDDDAQTLGRTLERNGHEVRIAATGSQARPSFPWADLVLLELELPDIDGVMICREIRSGRDAAVIITSTRAAEVDKVLGLQSGSDDYLVKPFGTRELLARIEAVMRRVRHEPEQPRTVVRGPLRIDPVGHEVHVGTRQVHVTRKEFNLLYLLASSPDRVLSRERIMSEVWQDDWTASRTIDTHVSMLRRKLGSGQWIVTVRGVGFRLGNALAPVPPQPG
ncbi:response regulator transcription factor [Streptomyces hainanensis]|uniref:response regulator transcription factor n=1 Tax=Streptomyces hainanensis TaxID=402648 RepID=UPI001FB5E7DE|nr:response regulator transcription factor [Streptomyces hainanensis]